MIRPIPAWAVHVLWGVISVATRAFSQSPLELPEVVVEGIDQPVAPERARFAADTPPPPPPSVVQARKTSRDGVPQWAPLGVLLPGTPAPVRKLAYRVGAGFHQSLDGALLALVPQDDGQLTLRVDTGRSAGHVEDAAARQFSGHAQAGWARKSGRAFSADLAVGERRLWGRAAGPTARRTWAGGEGMQPWSQLRGEGLIRGGAEYYSLSVGDHRSSGAVADVSAHLSWRQPGRGLWTARSAAQVEPGARLLRAGAVWGSGRRALMHAGLDALVSSVDGKDEIRLLPAIRLAWEHGVAGTVFLGVSRVAELDGARSVLRRWVPAEPLAIAPVLETADPRIELGVRERGEYHFSLFYERRSAQSVWVEHELGLLERTRAATQAWVAEGGVEGLEYKLSGRAEIVGSHAPVPYVPGLRGSLRALWGPGEHDAWIGVTARGASRASRDWGESAEIAGWWTMDLAVASGVGGGFSVALESRNVLNRKYEMWQGYPESGIWLGLALRHGWTDWNSEAER